MIDLKPVIDTTTCNESQASFVKFEHFENLNETINLMSPPKTQDTHPQWTPDSHSNDAHGDQTHT